MWGFDETTLPPLLELVESSSPNCRTVSHLSIIAHYLSSKQALKAVGKVVTMAETLRNNDLRFKTLGIGLAEGELIAEFDWLGRVKTHRTQPLGDSVNVAARIGLDM